MAVLLIDIGNTRIKWARLDGERLARGKAAVHSGWRPADYARHLFRPARGLNGLVVSSVAGARVNRVIASGRSWLFCRYWFDAVVSMHRQWISPLIRSATALAMAR